MQDEIAPKSKITFTYYMPDHEHEINLHINGFKMFNLLWEIDQKCRGIVKYGDEEKYPEKIQFADEIRDMIRSSIDLYQNH